MTTLVKICGLRDRETVAAIRHLPIDYIGFVFAASKRQVTADQAASLAEQLSAGSQSRQPQIVGVFVDPTIDQLAEALRSVPLDVVQLHGQETPEFCRTVKEAWGVQVFKALPVAEHAVTESGGQAIRMPDEYVQAIDALMLDTFDAKAAGGTGKTFRWPVIPEYRQWAEQAGIPLIVAGGLHADNVAGLIARYMPHGVDVSSGVETNGVKDIAKIEAFVERVKNVVSYDA